MIKIFTICVSLILFAFSSSFAQKPPKPAKISPEVLASHKAEGCRSALLVGYQHCYKKFIQPMIYNVPGLYGKKISAATRKAFVDVTGMEPCKIDKTMLRLFTSKIGFQYLVKKLKPGWFRDAMNMVKLFLKDIGIRKNTQIPVDCEKVMQMTRVKGKFVKYRLSGKTKSVYAKLDDLGKESLKSECSFSDTTEKLIQKRASKAFEGFYKAASGSLTLSEIRNLVRTWNTKHKLGVPSGYEKFVYGVLRSTIFRNLKGSLSSDQVTFVKNCFKQRKQPEKWAVCLLYQLKDPKKGRLFGGKKEVAKAIHMFKKHGLLYFGYTKEQLDLLEKLLKGHEAVLNNYDLHRVLQIMYDPGGNMAVPEKQGIIVTVPDKKEMKDFVYIVMHELGHVIDHRYGFSIGKDGGAWQKLTWKGGVFSEEKGRPFLCKTLSKPEIKRSKGVMDTLMSRHGFVSSYSTSNPCEDFGEAIGYCLVKGVPRIPSLKNKRKFIEKVLGRTCK